MVVLVATVADKAEIVAERIRTTFEGETFEEIDPELRVTISVGVTEFQRGEALDETLARADEAMYRAKKKGRNAIMRA